MIYLLKKATLFDCTQTLVLYETCWKWQKMLQERQHQYKLRKQPVPDSVLVVQHPSTYTLGRGSSLSNIKFSIDTKFSSNTLYRIERGGEVTWHGPGQLVIYPIIDLHNYKKDLHWYMRTLEETVIKTLADYNVHGNRNEVNAGVWVGTNKICAVGITASRWITMHGLAINIRCDLSHYDHIIPCGIQRENYGVCSLENIVPDISVEDVKQKFLKHFSEVFNIEYISDATPQKTLDKYLLHFPDINKANITRII